MTDADGVAFHIGGRVVTMPIQQWHAFAKAILQTQADKPVAERKRLLELYNALRTNASLEEGLQAIETFLASEWRNWLEQEWQDQIRALIQAPAAAAQDKEDDPHSRVRVRLEELDLTDGLPEGGWACSLFSVGHSLGKGTRPARDSSGNVVCLRTIDGQSRWLPGNAIEITLEITENDVKRTETILLEGFEPKTLVLREDPAHGRRELLRLIPVSGHNPCSAL